MRAILRRASRCHRPRKRLKIRSEDASQRLIRERQREGVTLRLRPNFTKACSCVRFRLFLAFFEIQKCFLFLCHRRPKSAIFRPPRVKTNHELEVDRAVIWAQRTVRTDMRNTAPLRETAPLAGAQATGTPASDYRASRRRTIVRGFAYYGPHLPTPANIGDVAESSVIRKAPHRSSESPTLAWGS
jgi:hypothetical protein